MKHLQNIGLLEVLITKNEEALKEHLSIKTSIGLDSYQTGITFNSSSDYEVMNVANHFINNLQTYELDEDGNIYPHFSRERDPKKRYLPFKPVVKELHENLEFDGICTNINEYDDIDCCIYKLTDAIKNWILESNQEN